MKSEATLLIIAFFLSALKIVEHFKKVLDLKDVSELSMFYTSIGIITGFIWLYIQVKRGSNLGAGMVSMSIALELYVLYIILEREMKSFKYSEKDKT